MATQIPQVTPKTIVLVLISAGVSHGAGGFGITPSGKLKKIPDNNPQLRRMAGAAQTLSIIEQIGMPDLAGVAQSALLDAAQRVAAELQ